MVRYLITNVKTEGYDSSQPLALRYRSANGTFYEVIKIDDFVKSREDGRHSKKLQMQDARILRNEAYIEVRCNDER
jgi:hypothetical protein